MIFVELRSQESGLIDEMGGGEVVTGSASEGWDSVEFWRV